MTQRQEDLQGSKRSQWDPCTDNDQFRVPDVSLRFLSGDKMLFISCRRLVLRFVQERCTEIRLTRLHASRNCTLESDWNWSRSVQASFWFQFTRIVNSSRGWRDNAIPLHFKSCSQTLARDSRILLHNFSYNPQTHYAPPKHTRTDSVVAYCLPKATLDFSSLKPLEVKFACVFRKIQLFSFTGSDSLTVHSTSCKRMRGSHDINTKRRRSSAYTSPQIVRNLPDR